MNNKFLLPVFTLLLLFCLASCSRKNGLEELPNRHPVRAISGEATSELVGRLLSENNEQLLQVNQVVNLQTADRYYTLVYFTTTTGNSNMLIEYQQEGEALIAQKSYRCTGSCGCLVEASVDTGGTIHIDCTCSTCTMLVNNI